jgi:hypothetical protein
MERLELFYVDYFDETSSRLRPAVLRDLAKSLLFLRLAPRLEKSEFFSVVALPQIHAFAAGLEFKFDDGSVVSVIVSFEGDKVALIATYAGSSDDIPPAAFARLTKEVEFVLRQMGAVAKAPKGGF